MKKYYANLLNLIIVIGILLAVSGCKMLSGAGGNTGQTNNPTADKSKTSGGLADDIIGIWEIEGKDKTRFTFGKDGSLIVKQGESVTQNATYKLLDNEAIEVKSEGKPKLLIIIKISGDTMRMNTQNRGSETLKRIN